MAPVLPVLDEKFIGMVDLMVAMGERRIDHCKSDRNLNTLIDFRYTHFKAQHGKPGSKRNKTGANGKDLILKVPVGTQIYEEDNNTVYDFIKNKEKYLVASGGKEVLAMSDLKVQSIGRQEKNKR